MHRAELAAGDHLARLLHQRVAAIVERHRVDDAGVASPRRAARARRPRVIASGLSEITCLPSRERGEDHRHVQVVRRRVVDDVDVGIGDERLVAAVRLRDAERVRLAARGRLAARRDRRRRRRSRAGGPRRCGARRRSPGRPGPSRCVSRAAPASRTPSTSSLPRSTCPRRGTRIRCRRGIGHFSFFSSCSTSRIGVSPWPHGMLSPWFFLRSFRCRFVMSAWCSRM